jgi:integration host factor subunit alpha
MALTKENIINKLYNQCGLSKQKSVELVESLLESIKQTLESGEDVLISGFGKFCVNEKNERRGRNPQTGEDLPLRARRVVTYKASGILREKINRKPKKQANKVSASLILLAIINKSRSKKGVDTATLKKKSGFDDRKIWNVINSLKSQGKIKSGGRGFYVKA